MRVQFVPRIRVEWGSLCSGGDPTWAPVGGSLGGSGVVLTCFLFGTEVAVTVCDPTRGLHEDSKVHGMAFSRIAGIIAPGRGRSLS